MKRGDLLRHPRHNGRELFVEALWNDGTAGDRRAGGLHLSAVGNAVQRVRERPTRTMAKSLKELESKFKNQES